MKPEAKGEDNARAALQILRKWWNDHYGDETKVVFDGGEEEGVLTAHDVFEMGMGDG